MAVDSGSYDEATINRQRIAAAMSHGFLKPDENIRHWSQGLANMAKAGIGGYLGYQAGQDAKTEEAARNAELYKAAGLPPPAAPASTPSIFDRIASAMTPGGEGAATPPTPASAPASPASLPAAPPTQPSSAGKIYDANEPSPLDPPSGGDRKAMIATILGEASNQPATGQNAVASVIRNRAVNGGYGGNTPAGVVTAPKQFEPWNTPEGRARMERASADPTQAATADKAIALAYGEGGQAPTDPTNGAVNFIQPKLQTALGRDMPKWAQGPGQDIGDHRFFGGKPQDPTQQPYQVAGPATAAPPAAAPSAVAQAMPAPQMPSGMFSGVPKEQIPALLSGLTSKNPTMKALAVQQLGNYTKAEGPTDDIKEFNAENAMRAKRGEAPMSSLGEWIRGNKAAGANKINIDASQKGENKFEEKAGALQAERLDKIIQGGNEAKSMVSDLQSLRDIGTRITTGKTAEMTASLGPYAEALGVKIDGLDDLQAFKAITSRLAPQMRVPGSGATSDFEMRTFLEGLPSLGKTPGGNELISKTLEAMAEHKIKAAEIASQAINGEIKRKDADKMLRELPDPLALWKQSRGTEMKTKTEKPPANVDPAAYEEAKKRGLVK